MMQRSPWANQCNFVNDSSMARLIQPSFVKMVSEMQTVDFYSATPWANRCTFVNNDGSLWQDASFTQVLSKSGQW